MNDEIAALVAAAARSDELAKEAAFVELYRKGLITQHQLAESLGKTRFEIDVLLKRRNVTEDLVTAEEVAEQVPTLRRLLAPRDIFSAG